MSNERKIIPGFVADRALPHTRQVHSARDDKRPISCPLGMHYDGEDCVPDSESAPDEIWVEEGSGENDSDIEPMPDE